MVRYMDGGKAAVFTKSSETNLTVKACPPFLDSLLSGYVITLPADVVVVKNEKESFDFLWKSEIPLVSGHSVNQVSQEQIGEQFFSEPFKWINYWGISLPEGYSALFIHPLNRTDLPFYTLSGVVDCDSYNLPVHFPFLLNKNFVGTIPAGTPVAQIIPIKREVWSHSVDGFDEKYKDKKDSDFFRTAFHAYKNLYWSRKEYK